MWAGLLSELTCTSRYMYLCRDFAHNTNLAAQHTFNLFQQCDDLQCGPIVSARENVPTLASTPLNSNLLQQTTFIIKSTLA